jgi:hypothetical protein
MKTFTREFFQKTGARGGKKSWKNLTKKERKARMDRINAAKNKKITAKKLSTGVGL